MTFLCYFKKPSHIQPARGRLLMDSEVKDSTLVAAARSCEILSETDARFLMGGFGTPDWNLDVWYDLSTFLEQASDAMADLHRGIEFEIALYAQGTERTLTFRPHENNVTIECVSQTQWQPIPPEEEIASDKLMSMLIQVADDVSQSLKEIDEDAELIEPFSSWIRKKFW